MRLRAVAEEAVADMEERYSRVEEAVHQAERIGEKERLRARRAKEVRRSYPMAASLDP